MCLGPIRWLASEELALFITICYGLAREQSLQTIRQMYPGWPCIYSNFRTILAEQSVPANHSRSRRARLWKRLYYMQYLRELYKRWVTFQPNHWSKAIMEDTWDTLWRNSPAATTSSWTYNSTKYVSYAESLFFKNCKPKLPRWSLLSICWTLCKHGYTPACK